MIFLIFQTIFIKPLWGFSIDNVLLKGQKHREVFEEDIELTRLRVLCRE